MFLKTWEFFRTTQKLDFIWVKVEKWLSSVDDEELHTSLHLDGQYKTATRPKGLHHAVTVGWKSAKMSHSIFRIAIWTSMAKLYRLKNWIKMRHFGTFSTIVFNVFKNILAQLNVANSTSTKIHNVWKILKKSHLTKLRAKRATFVYYTFGS